MFGKLLRKLGLKSSDAQIADTILTGIANKATGGAASKVEDVIETVARKRKGG